MAVMLSRDFGEILDDMTGMFRFAYALLLFTALSNAPAFARTLYVSPSGNDANPGTAARPLASLAGARNRVRELKARGAQEDIIVSFRAGVYSLPEPVVFESTDGGSGNQTITYRGTGTTQPVFSGGKKLTGFTKTADGLWSLYLPEVKNGSWYFEDLYVNGIRATRAKWPDDGYFHLVQVSENVLRKGAGPIAESALQTITVSPQQAALLNTIPANQLTDVLLSFNHKWDNTKKRIQSYNPATRQVTTGGMGLIPWNMLDAKSTFTIENAKAALDTPGEWFLDRQSGYLYYKPRSTDNITTTYGYVPVINQFITIAGKPGAKVQNLRFENLSFQYTAFIAPPQGVDPVQAAATVDATVVIDFADKVVFDNCAFLHTGIYCIWFRKNCTAGMVSHCRLWDMGAGGIKMGEMNHDPAVDNTVGITVDNNIIQQGGKVFPCAVGILLFTAGDCRITHNDIADFSYSGISAGWVWGNGTTYSKRNDISYNHIHHLGWGVLSDMGGIYTLGNAEGTVISHNRIHDVYSYDYGGWGVHNDESSAGILIRDNLMYNCKSAAYEDHLGKQNVIMNNLFYNQMEQQLQANSGEASDRLTFLHNIVVFSRGKLCDPYWNMSKSISDSNAYWDSRGIPIKFGDKTFQQWQAAGMDVHSVVADPLLLNPDKGDFTIGNKMLLKKIGFTVFDYEAAGVYGSSSWKQAASLTPATVARFKNLYRSKN